MVDIITSGAVVISPSLILGYESEREAGTLVHPILGSSDDEITLRPARRRTGTLRLAFLDERSESDSLDAETALSQGAVFTLTSDDRTTIAMQFVVPSTGRVVRRLDDETRLDWTVTVDFQEVTP